MCTNDNYSNKYNAASFNRSVPKPLAFVHEVPETQNKY